MDIKPIETVYSGYKFRSRLEARWAVFFDACGVNWEYEPEGFDLGDGLWYLPDLLLHDVVLAYEYDGRSYEYSISKLWVEVKGDMREIDAKKILKFADIHHHAYDTYDSYLDEFITTDLMITSNPILVTTSIPKGCDCKDLQRSICNLSRKSKIPTSFNLETVTGHSSAIGIPCVNLDKKFTLVDVDSFDESLLINYERTFEAYDLARQAQFEHGVKSKSFLSEDIDFKALENLNALAWFCYYKTKAYRQYAEVIDAKYFETIGYRYKNGTIMYKPVFEYKGEFYSRFDVFEYELYGSDEVCQMPDGTLLVSLKSDAKYLPRKFLARYGISPKGVFDDYQIDMLNRFRQHAKVINAKRIKVLEYKNRDGSIHHVPIFEYNGELYLQRIDVQPVEMVYDDDAEFYQNEDGIVLISWEYCLNTFYQEPSGSRWEEWMHNNFKKIIGELNG